MEKNMNIEWKKITAKQLLIEFKKECEKMEREELYSITRGLFKTWVTLKRVSINRYGNTKRICDLAEYLDIAQKTYLTRFMK